MRCSDVARRSRQVDEEEVFLEHLWLKYAHQAALLLGHQQRDPARSPRSSASTSPAGVSSLAEGQGPVETLDTMSGGDAPPPGPFTRGSRARASLPLVRSASQGSETPAGVLYLQFDGQTRQVRMPSSISGLDTVRALFASAFPQQLTMATLASPTIAVYIKDASRNLYYKMEDIRQITPQCCLKVYFKDSSHVFNHHARPVRSASIDGRVTREVLYRGHSPMLATSSRSTLHHLQGEPISPPTVRSVPVSPAHAAYAGGSAEGGGIPVQGSSGGPGSATLPQERLSVAGPSLSISSSGSSIMERRDVRPDGPVSISSRGGNRGPHYPNPYCFSYGSSLQGARLSMASSQGSAPPSLATELADGGGGLAGLTQYRASVRPLGACEDVPLEHHAYSLHRQNSRKYADGQLPLLAAKSPPPSPQRRWMLADWQASGPGSPEQTSPRRRSLRRESSGAEVASRGRGSRSSSSSSSVFVSDSPRGFPNSPPQGLVSASDPESQRIKSMEQQIASLAGLVQHALAVAPSVAGSKDLASEVDGQRLLNSGPGPTAALVATSPVPAATSPSLDPAPGGVGHRRLAATAKDTVSDLRLQLSQLRQLQLDNQESVRSMLQMVGQGLVVLCCDRPAQPEPAGYRRRAEMEKERMHYLNLEESVLTQLSELEDYVAHLKRHSTSSASELSVTLGDIEQGAVNLRRVGEGLAMLKRDFPELQVKMRAVLRVEVEAVRFLKEEPLKMDAMLKRVKTLTECLGALRRCATESLPQPTDWQYGQGSPGTRRSSTAAPPHTWVAWSSHHPTSTPLTLTCGPDSPTAAKVSPAHSRDSSPALLKRPAPAQADLIQLTPVTSSTGDVFAHTQTQTEVTARDAPAARQSQPEASPRPASQPEASPCPATKPEPSLRPASQPEASLRPASQPEASSRPASQPEPSPRPATKPEPSPRPASQPEPSPHPANEPEPSLRPASQPEASPRPASQPEPSSRPASQPEPPAPGPATQSELIPSQSASQSNAARHTVDVQQTLQRAQGSLMRALPEMEVSHPGALSPTSDREVAPQDLTPLAPAGPPRDPPPPSTPSGPQVEKPSRASVAREQCSPPPPPPRRVYAAVPGLATGRSGEVIFTARNKDGNRKEQGTAPPAAPRPKTPRQPPEIKPKPYRQPPEVKPKPPRHHTRPEPEPPAATANAAGTDAAEDGRFKKELQVFQKCTVREVGGRPLVDLADTDRQTQEIDPKVYMYYDTAQLSNENLPETENTQCQRVERVLHTSQVVDESLAELTQLPDLLTPASLLSTPSTPCTTEEDILNKQLTSNGPRGATVSESGSSGADQKKDDKELIEQVPTSRVSPAENMALPPVVSRVKENVLTIDRIYPGHVNVKEVGHQETTPNQTPLKTKMDVPSGVALQKENKPNSDLPGLPTDHKHSEVIQDLPSPNSERTVTLTTVVTLQRDTAGIMESCQTHDSRSQPVSNAAEKKSNLTVVVTLKKETSLIEGGAVATSVSQQQQMQGQSVRSGQVCATGISPQQSPGDQPGYTEEVVVEEEKKGDEEEKEEGGGSLSPDLDGDECAPPPPPPSNKIALQIAKAKAKAQAVAGNKHAAGKTGSCETPPTIIVEQCGGYHGVEDGDGQPVIIIFNEPMDIQSAYKRLSTIFESEEDLDRILPGLSIEEESVEEGEEEIPFMIKSSDETQPGDHVADDTVNSPQQQMNPSPCDFSLTPDGREERLKPGTKKKFKFKFPKNKLAAISQAIRAGSTKTGKKTLQVVVYEEEEDNKPTKDTAKEMQEPKTFEVNSVKWQHGLGQVENRSVRSSLSKMQSRTEELCKSAYASIDSLEESIKQLEISVDSMATSSPPMSPGPAGVSRQLQQQSKAPRERERSPSKRPAPQAPKPPQRKKAKAQPPKEAATAPVAKKQTSSSILPSKSRQSSSSSSASSEKAVNGHKSLLFKQPRLVTTPR